MVYIGVDPGKRGGYAFVGDDGDGAEVYPWDDMGFVESMKALSTCRCVAAVEKVSAMPGQGTVSMFSFGQSYGFILGVLTAYGIPYQLVPPRKWKSEFSLTNDKGKSIEVCKRLFPGVDLKRTERCKTDSDGKAESLLIAEWCRRKL